MQIRPPTADTPHVRVDTDVLDANITAMAARVAAQGLALRPHAKTHKSPEVGRRQIASGAIGLTVATIGEAQAFAAAGFDDLFLAYPLWLTASKAARLRSVARIASVRVAVDSVAGAVAMAEALGDDRDSVEVLVEVDSGQHRTGAAPREAGIVAARAVAHGLRVVGVFTFPGHGYSPTARETAAHQEARAITDAADALSSAGVDPIVRSGGSTPTVEFAHPDVLTEVRPGVYPFNDAQQVALGRASIDEVALSVIATVVRSEPGRAVLDCGSKILGSEKPDWVPGFGILPDLPDARIVALSEHHATVVGEGLPDAGSIVRVVPNHVCITVNLVDELVAVTGGIEVGRWPLLARGANS